MRKRSFWSSGLASLGIVAIAAVFSLSATGCVSRLCFTKCHGGKCASKCASKCGTKKCAGKCDGKKCAGKCATPCKKSDAGAKGVSAAPVNKNCPISGNPVNPGVTTVSAGKTVGFCCGGCVGKWKQLAQADKDAKLATAM